MVRWMLFGSLGVLVHGATVVVLNNQADAHVTVTAPAQQHVTAGGRHEIHNLGGVTNFGAADRIALMVGSAPHRDLPPHGGLFDAPLPQGTQRYAVVVVDAAGGVVLHDTNDLQVSKLLPTHYPTHYLTHGAARHQRRPAAGGALARGARLLQGGRELRQLQVRGGAHVRRAPRTARNAGVRRAVVEPRVLAPLQRGRPGAGAPRAEVHRAARPRHPDPARVSRGGRRARLPHAGAVPRADGQTRGAGPPGARTRGLGRRRHADLRAAGNAHQQHVRGLGRGRPPLAHGRRDVRRRLRAAGQEGAVRGAGARQLPALPEGVRVRPLARSLARSLARGLLASAFSFFY